MNLGLYLYEKDARCYLVLEDVLNNRENIEKNNTGNERKLNLTTNIKNFEFDLKQFEIGKH